MRISLYSIVFMVNSRIRVRVMARVLLYLSCALTPFSNIRVRISLYGIAFMVNSRIRGMVMARVRVRTMLTIT